jgi:AraC-like DNA-binding protein
MSLLSDALKNRLLPWSRQNRAERFIIAREKMSAAQMPDGVTLARRKVTGPRVLVKNRRLYGNVRSLKATWPEAKLGEYLQYKMLCVLDGGIDFQVGNHAVQCGEGFYLIVPPGIKQPMGQPYHAPGGFCDVLNVVLRSHAVQCTLAHGQEGQNYVHTREDYLFKNESLVVLFDLLMQEILGNRTHSLRIAADLLPTFWEILQRDLEEERYINPGPIGRPKTAKEKNIGFEAELLHYIQTHFTRPLTLETTARELYLSRTQFVRKMRQETGKTFVQFLTDYRIAEAKVLLRDSDWTVNAIAEFLGYSSASYFQKVFRREARQSPSKYRKSVQQK